MAWIRYHVAYSFVFVQPLAKSSPVGISECRMSWKSIWGKFTASAYWRHLWTARPNTSDFLKPKACASFRTLAVFIDGDWRFPLIFPTETTSVKQSPVASWRNKPKFIKKKKDWRNRIGSHRNIFMHQHKTEPTLLHRLFATNFCILFDIFDRDNLITSDIFPKFAARWCENSYPCANFHDSSDSLNS